MLATLLFSQSATAAAVGTAVVDGKCTSVTAAKGCLLMGNINTSANGNNSYLEAQKAYNLYNDTHAGAGPDIKLNPIIQSDDATFDKLFDMTDAGTTSGTWALNGFLVNYIGVKAGSNFVLYGLATPSSSGTWNTFDLPGIKNGPNKGEPQGLSHITFFGTSSSVSAVPEPATWAMMLLGFGFVGFVMRRRRTAQGSSPALAA